MIPGRGSTFDSFSEIHYDEFSKRRLDRIKYDIETQEKEYILSVDEQEFINSLVNNYLLEPITIDLDSEYIPEPFISIEKKTYQDYGQDFEVKTYNFTIKYKFTGSSILFQVRPQTYTLTHHEIFVDYDNQTVSFNFSMINEDPKQFEKLKSFSYDRAFKNLKGVNDFADNWNKRLLSSVNLMYKGIKDQYLKEKQFYSAINVKVNKNTSIVFSAPIIKKRIIPMPKTSPGKEISTSPTMAKQMYDDILKVIYGVGKSMEKKPSTYTGKNEEELRNQLLLFLETRYESTVASAETFNKKGKTDIILKFEDNSNLFVAECKIWRGPIEFLKGITQLFDGYLTWRDSKTAIIVFIKNNDFTSVLNSIKTEISNHEYFVKFVENRGDSSFSYLFHLPADKDKHVFLEVIAFHFDEL